MARPVTPVPGCAMLRRMPADTMANQARRSRNGPSARAWLAGVLNLLVPGLGIIYLGRAWTGLIVGLIFAAFANLALWAVLLIPDDLPDWGPPLALGLAAGAYVGCQVNFVKSSRDRQKCAQEAVRRSALAAVGQALECGDFNAAQAALEPVRHLASQDLLVAYRLAQVLTGLGDAQAACAAWRQVKTLDRHRIYRDEWQTDASEALHSFAAAAQQAPPSAHQSDLRRFLGR